MHRPAFTLWPHPNYWCTQELAFYFLIGKDEFETDHIGFVCSCVRVHLTKKRILVLLLLVRLSDTKKERCFCVATHDEVSSWLLSGVHSASFSVAFKVRRFSHFAIFDLVLMCVKPSIAVGPCSQVAGVSHCKRRRPELPHQFANPGKYASPKNKIQTPLGV